MTVSGSVTSVSSRCRGVGLQCVVVVFFDHANLLLVREKCHTLSFYKKYMCVRLYVLCIEFVSELERSAYKWL